MAPTRPLKNFAIFYTRRKQSSNEGWTTMMRLASSQLNWGRSSGLWCRSKLRTNNHWLFTLPSAARERGARKRLQVGMSVVGLPRYVIYVRTAVYIHKCTTTYLMQIHRVISPELTTKWRVVNHRKTWHIVPSVLCIRWKCAWRLHKLYLY